VGRRGGGRGGRLGSALQLPCFCIVFLLLSSACGYLRRNGDGTCLTIRLGSWVKPERVLHDAPWSPRMHPRAVPKAACGQAAVRGCCTFNELTSRFFVRRSMTPSGQRETGGTGREPARHSHKGWPQPTHYAVGTTLYYPRRTNGCNGGGAAATRCAKATAAAAFPL